MLPEAYCRPFLPLALLALAACSSPDEVAADAGVRHHSASASASAASSGPRAGAAQAVKEDNDLYSYAFVYPAQVGAHPLLAQKLQREADAAKAQLIKESKEALAESKANGFPYNPHSWMEEWKVVTDLPDYLSLSGDFSTYTGGAHGMYGLTSLVWDKRNKAALDGIELFASPAALDAALGQALCDKLDAERAKKRGEAVPQTPAGEDYGFNSCQHIKDATVLVGSSNHRTFDRLTVWFGPYVAGPYAEGAYELDFPVDAKVLAAVKPEYRSAFSVKK
jgi:hypothetical protein